MMCLKTAFVLLALATFLGHFQQVEGRKAQQEKKGRGRVTSAPNMALQSRTGHDKKVKTSRNVASKGRFTNEEKMQCSWEAIGDQTLILSIRCSKENQSIHCEYTANPGLCPQFQSSAAKFWKQISRSLKKQKKLCQDPKALIKASVCKNTGKESHFSLKTSANTQRPQQPSEKDCRGLSNGQKLAKEYCSSSWSSVCAFFFTMVENEDC
ncbi:fibroblast growth factor-binding protein 1 [Hoplias malabaricus]|uniref:fibroblast growth factor-binding protein 1 n=1 Tax=Hoplias malabaricus TaxID=27720 RepID=UPI00346250D0